MASNLSCSELFKYPWRVEKFLEKFKNEELFTLVDGNVVKLLYSCQIETWIKTENRKQLMRDILQTGNGNLIKLSDLRKTGEFGGKSSDHATKVESHEIISINKQITEIKSQTSLEVINLKIHENVYSVSVCSKINGTPKADFSLSDSLGNEVVWISHKKGSKATHFQQWGGITEEGIKDHSEVENFAKTLSDKFPKGLCGGSTYVRFILDETLKHRSVYGIGYNKEPFGVQNVTAVIQGQIQLTRSDNIFNLTSNHIHCNGENITGQFEPVLGVRFTNDRSQFNIPNSRFMIAPKEGRKYEII